MRLAEFLQSTEADEVIGMQKLHDEQSLDVRKKAIENFDQEAQKIKADFEINTLSELITDAPYIPKKLEDF